MSDRLSHEAEQLVRAARTHLAPTPHDVDRLRTRILAGVAAGASVTAAGIASAAAAPGGVAASAGTAGASAGAAAGIGVLKVVVVAAAVTGASVTGGVLITRRLDRPEAVSASTRPSAAGKAAPRAPARAPDPDLHPDPVPVPDPAPESPPIQRQRALAPPVPSLASEMDLLRRARAALRSGDPRSALQHLDHHARQFPASPLGPEAAAIRVEATCATGDRETARALADQFARRWPDSPLARRVTRLCGDDR